MSGQGDFLCPVGNGEVPGKNSIASGQRVLVEEDLFPSLRVPGKTECYLPTGYCDNMLCGGFFPFPVSLLDYNNPGFWQIEPWNLPRRLVMWAEAAVQGQDLTAPRPVHLSIQVPPLCVSCVPAVSCWNVSPASSSSSLPGEESVLANLSV
ncbi:hypothetical protein CapIbe_015974 [Capra ibex]